MCYDEQEVQPDQAELDRDFWSGYFRPIWLAFPTILTGIFINPINLSIYPIPLASCLLSVHVIKKNTKSNHGEQCHHSRGRHGQCWMPSNIICKGTKNLKTFDTKSCVVTNGTTQSGSMIVAFNLQQLTEVCHRNSTKYNSSLCDFDVIASEIFKEGETWVDRTLVKDVMDRLASLHGWTTKITQAHLQCNRFGTNDTTRQFASGSLKSGCPFRITLTPWNRSKTKKVILTTGKQKWIYTDDWSAPVIIQRANCTHGGTCIHISEPTRPY